MCSCRCFGTNFSVLFSVCFINLVDPQILGACPEMCCQNERCWLAKKITSFSLNRGCQLEAFCQAAHHGRQTWSPSPTRVISSFLFSMFFLIKSKRSVWEGEWTQQLSGSVWKRDKQHEGTADELIESCLVMRRGIAAAIIPTAPLLFFESNPHSREKDIFARNTFFERGRPSRRTDFFLKEVASNFSLAWVRGGWWKVVKQGRRHYMSDSLNGST